MAAPSKTQLLNQVHSTLRKRYKLGPRPGRLSVLEAVVFGICHEGTTREQANQALSRFKDEFFDWNEVRVSSLEEIQGVLAGLPDPEERAGRIRRFLRQLFDKTYSFALDSLLKKSLKDSIKHLHDYEALQSDYVLATVIQQALGGHAIPVDGPMLRAMERLGVSDPGTEPKVLRGLLERAIPKNRGAEFVDLVEELAFDPCVEKEPRCSKCELKKICPTGHRRLTAPKPAAKKALAKPKASSAAKHTATTKVAKKAKPAAKPAAQAKVSKSPKKKVVARPVAKSPPKKASPSKAKPRRQK